MRNFQMQAIFFSATIPIQTVFFQENAAAKILFCTFASWICDFATAFNNNCMTSAQSHCFYVLILLVFLLPSHLCLQFHRYHLVTTVIIDHFLTRKIWLTATVPAKNLSYRP